MVSTVMSLYAIPQLILSVFLYTPLSTKLGVPFTFLIGAALYTLPIIHVLTMSYAGVCIFLGGAIQCGGIFIGAGCPVIIKLVTPISHRGKVNGFQGSFQKIFAVLSSTAMGAAYKLDRRVPFGIIGAFGILCMIGGFFIITGVKKFEKLNEKEEKPATMIVPTGEPVTAATMK
jgi:MFS family permease